MELRRWMLKAAIALEIGDKGLVRDHRFVTALGHHGEIVQVRQWTGPPESKSLKTPITISTAAKGKIAPTEASVIPRDAVRERRGVNTAATVMST